MTIAITGINGFIGQNLARKLQEKNHKVIGIGKDKESKVSNVSYFNGDILDKKFLENVLQNSDAVVHLAAITSHEEIVNKKEEAEKINLLGTKNVLDVFSKSKVEKFLYASTGKVYGKVVYLPIDEKHPTNPQNILGKSKLKVEKLIESYKNKSKQFIIFRVFNVYGPEQNKNFLIPTILRQLSDDEKEIILGDIKAKRDYLYIDDLVDAFVLAIESKLSPGISVYNICTKIASSASEIVNLIGKIREMEIKIKVNPNLIRKDESPNEYGSFELAKKELGWEPKMNLEQGLRKIITE